MGTELKILIVDDAPNNLALLYRHLRREYQVLRAASGTEALDILNAEGEPGLLITDSSMPDMNGLELISKVRAMFPDTPCLLTGSSSEGTPDGVYHVFSSPLSLPELDDVVDRATEQYRTAKGYS